MANGKTIRRDMGLSFRKSGLLRVQLQITCAMQDANTSVVLNKVMVAADYTRRQQASRVV
jgi:hypothetical protein